MVFGDIVIIWQVKDLKLKNDGQYGWSEIEKNFRQLLGARRQLFQLKTPVALQNSRRRQEVFDPTKVKEAFLVSVLLGEGESMFSFAETIKKHTIHVFTKEFLQIALGELDTTSDFAQYLRKKEEFLSSDRAIVIEGGEEEFLAHYVMHNRSFEDFADASAIFIQNGLWEGFRSRPEYEARQKENKISRLWDRMIDTAHEGGEEYELVARELARPSRFQRRVLSKVFRDAQIQANDNNTAPIWRRRFSFDGMVYCFLFMNESDPRDHRKTMLCAMCSIARVLHPENEKILGIATEKKIQYMTSFDFCFFYLPALTQEFVDKARKLQSDTGIFTESIDTQFGEDEYPQL